MAAAAVTIDSDVTDATQMRFRDAGGNWTEWEAYTNVRSWTLPAGDGAKTVEAEYRTRQSTQVALEDTIKLDGTAPQTTAGRFGAGWHHSAVTVSLLASDGGSGVQIIRTTVDGVEQPALTAVASLRIATPADHSNDGLHTMTYTAQDGAGNWEAIKTLEVGIDTRRPTPRAGSQASVKRHKTATLKYRVADAGPNGGPAAVTIKVKTPRGTTVKTFVLKNVVVNSPQKYRSRCHLKKGSYRLVISATDAAGNSQSKVVGNTLVVK